MTREERLARTLVELADTLVDDFDVVDLMSLLVERSVELLDASAAGLVLADSEGSLRLMASTSEAMELVELFQVQNDQGPCFDCYHSGEPVITGDLADAAGAVAPVRTVCHPRRLLRRPRSADAASPPGHRRPQPLPRRAGHPR